MIKYVLLACMLSPVLAFKANAIDPLTPLEVLTSARQYSPKILAAKEGQDIADAAILEAQGGFDASIEQEIFARTDGFYDGRQIDTKLVKPFAPLNSAFYTGYRVSDGSFPIYEDKRITTEGGEWLVGVKLSLLRNRAIDAKRLKLLNATVDRDTVQADIAIATLNVEEDALVYYWEWVAAGRTYDVYQQLLNIALDRQKAFQVKVNKGDLPRIYLTENKQYIVQRQENVLNAQRKFLEAANTLSLYYRGQDGVPIVAKNQQVPPTFSDLSNDIKTSTDDTWMMRRPEVQIMQAALAQLENTQSYGKNRRLPKADLMLEHANDYGSGVPSREDAETIVKLNVSIPLQQRKADGAIAQAKAKIRQLEHKNTQMMDGLQAQYNNLMVTLNTTRDYITLACKEITLAQTMQQAEQARVDNGDSDYFLLVLRDENLAKARIKHIAAYALYRQAEARMDALTMNLDNR